MTDEIVPDGQNTVWDGRPVVPELTFREDGTFVVADRLVNDQMKDRFPERQELGHGSYELKARALSLRHVRDGGPAETTTWAVRTLTASELVIVEQRSGSTRFLRRWHVGRATRATAAVSGRD